MLNLDHGKPASFKMKLIFAACLALPASAWAQGSDNYPSRPVTLIVPAAPGGGTDVEGRLWASKLGEGLGQQFVIDFKPGAAQTLGLSYVAKQKPDGYTLALISSTYPLLPALIRDLPFDMDKDLIPITLLSKRQSVLMVSNNLPVHNLQEYIAYARANPGKINFGTSGEGGVGHMMGLWLANATNTKVTFIPYKAASAIYPDLIAGRANMLVTTMAGGYPLIKAGKAGAIGMASLERSRLLPELPTIAEQGIPEYENPSWIGLLAPDKTAPAIINRLQSEAARIAKMPDFQQKLGEGQPVASTPAQFKTEIASAVARWRKLVIDNNIKIDNVD